MAGVSVQEWKLVSVKAVIAVGPVECSGLSVHQWTGKLEIFSS
jgi:hypothetical protein